jgi:tRNA threonylcarbamoyladenosine biosynthesis protein TsaB
VPNVKSVLVREGWNQLIMNDGMERDDQGSDVCLAIDTSTEQAGLALGVGDRVVVRSWAAGRTQTTSVLPAIDELFAEAGVAPGDVSSVVVATGPGTFTGLRVGMSIAKGIVLARHIPLVGVPTLEISAAGVPDNADLVALLPAGRGRVVWQRFGPHADTAPHNSTLDELIAALESMPEVLVVGELAEAHQGRVASVHPSVRWGYRDPSVLIRLGQERLERGEVDDPVTLEPVYLHGVTVQAGPVEDRLRRKR